MPSQLPEVLTGPCGTQEELQGATKSETSAEHTLTVLSYPCVHTRTVPGLQGLQLCSLICVHTQGRSLGSTLTVFFYPCAHKDSLVFRVCSSNSCQLLFCVWKVRGADSASNMPDPRA